MKKYNCTLLIFLLSTFGCYSQSIPAFGSEIPVTINGYSLDGMEPFISPDGNALFFNSLNNGINTSLYYAAKQNDSTFNLVGLVPAVNETVTPYLNAVASFDTLNNFYWVSLREYPNNFDNLHRVRFAPAGIENFGRVHGNFYIYSPGWLIMDAAINYRGNNLIYANAYFNNCAAGLPCISKLGIAEKVNDSTFNKGPNSDFIFSNVNDSNYIVYAPQISADELELYYTRILKNTLVSEICVSVRNNANSQFGLPSIIYTSPTLVPEGPTLTLDESKLYYHRKEGSTYKIFLRYRTSPSTIQESVKFSKILVYPNPANSQLLIRSAKSNDFNSTLGLFDLLGNLVLTIEIDSYQKEKTVDISHLKNGIYFLRSSDGINIQKLVINRN